MGKRKWTEAEIDAWRGSVGRKLFYFNRADGNFFIPRAYGFGFTPNWGHPAAWVMMAVVAALIVLRTLHII